MKLSELLKDKRKAKKLSIRGLARIAGVSASYLSDIEKGTSSNPREGVLLKLFKALDITRDDIFNCNDIIFNKDLVEAISTPESKKIANEAQEEYNKLQNDSKKKLVEQLKSLNFYIDKDGDDIILSYDGNSCNLNNKIYNNFSTDIDKAIMGIVLYYIHNYK
ncbi:helix-turn-helix domain-containing protein [Clostridium pasteurianum]|uniref:Putative transcriptional regulator with C-terminal CBS domains n=1 Tax=Clostridium pasteurianum BC1 TaxID=86416 RepID=R4K3R8_CLOPA|nr:helix-turn-helix transcriptional regulator [Clostridium pasteurianum]AGK95174.1 putative transcriptional regulator with C-terminal CBS domains [Clostridium pasteurianum BC1]